MKPAGDRTYAFRGAAKSFSSKITGSSKQTKPKSVNQGYGVEGIICNSDFTYFKFYDSDSSCLKIYDNDSDSSMFKKITPTLPRLHPKTFDLCESDSRLHNLGLPGGVIILFSPKGVA